MNTRILAAVVVIGGLIAAAAGGGYFAGRQNAPPQSAPAAAAEPSTTPTAKPVSETEAVVAAPTPPAPSATPARELKPEAEPPARKATAPERQPASRADRSQASPSKSAARNGREVAPAPASTAAPERPAAEREPVPTPPVIEPAPEPARPATPPPPPEPEFIEVVLPASAVIGLQVQTPLSSERARVEDRVEARVSRDVTAAGRVAIPAGSRVIGAVTLVERGGKMKERARLGVRFHTLVLADGREVPLRTEPIFREGESPSAESARKIGGAAIGGAILGAIMGGGKGAAIGSAAGAAGGSAAVMAGDRNAATLPVGTVVTVRLASPATIEVDKQ